MRAERAKRESKSLRVVRGLRGARAKGVCVRERDGGARELRGSPERESGEEWHEREMGKSCENGKGIER